MKQNNKPTKETVDLWHNDPGNWKWGIFYFNPKDKRIFPPKRNKYLGWTTNFANPLSILALLAIISILLLTGVYLNNQIRL